MADRGFPRVWSGSVRKRKPRRVGPPTDPPAAEPSPCSLEAGALVRHDGWSSGCKLVPVALSASAFQGRARHVFPGPCRWGPRTSVLSPQEVRAAGPDPESHNETAAATLLEARPYRGPRGAERDGVSACLGLTNRPSRRYDCRVPRLNSVTPAVFVRGARFLPPDQPHRRQGCRQRDVHVSDAEPVLAAHASAASSAAISASTSAIRSA